MTEGLVTLCMHFVELGQEEQTDHRLFLPFTF